MADAAQHEKHLKALADMILGAFDPISFCILEVGAASFDGRTEPFYQLPDIFPGSQIIGFEADTRLCDELNRNAGKGLKYFPFALGRSEETRNFYQTSHPQCSSLYRPNEELLRHYINMEVAKLDTVTSIETISLDRFIQDNDVSDIDFLKIDIQGAELDVFQGGLEALREVVMIISEAEFIPHYIDQPLFGDVCSYLAERGLMFHKFLGFGGRALKPLILDKNPNRPSQLLWSDSIFVRDIQLLPMLSVEKLLKLSVLGFLYGSVDLVFRCFTIVDQRKLTNMGQQFLKLIRKSI